MSRYRFVNIIFICFTFLLFSLPAKASPGKQTETEEPPQPSLSISDDTCLDCHGQPGSEMTLENGDSLSIYISSGLYYDSIHGQKGYACVQCHRTVGNYPHPEFNAADRRDLSLQLYEACQHCHTREYNLTLDSTHAEALASGKNEAAICTDCHTAHATRQLTDSETGELLPEAHAWIPKKCALCHNAIYQKYQDSVHGSALLEQGNPDVPTCIDCHGVHNIEDPTTPTFRISSPNLCAECHTDAERMNKYGLSTEVLNTYVADFHGTTITLFEKQSPEAESNKAVCYDCHGIHDIKSTDDPEKGIHVQQNLLERCQICHPEATLNFPYAWMSHYIPSPEKNPMVYYVNLFYKILIPGVLGGMALLVVLDFGKIFQTKYMHKKQDDLTTNINNKDDQSQKSEPDEWVSNQNHVMEHNTPANNYNAISDPSPQDQTDLDPKNNGEASHTESECSESGDEKQNE